jgi:hypothetical protein
MCQTLASLLDAQWLADDVRLSMLGGDDGTGTVHVGKERVMAVYRSCLPGTAASQKNTTRLPYHQRTTKQWEGSTERISMVAGRAWLAQGGVVLRRRIDKLCEQISGPPTSCSPSIGFRKVSICYTHELHMTTLRSTRFLS